MCEYSWLPEDEPYWSWWFLLSSVVYSLTFLTAHKLLDSLTCGMTSYTTNVVLVSSIITIVKVDHIRHITAWHWLTLPFSSTPSSNSDINTSLSCGHTERPVWISRRQPYWLWLILKHLWTSPMHVDTATHTRTHTFTHTDARRTATGVSSPCYCSQTGILTAAFRCSVGAQMGNNNRFEIHFFLSGQCFPKHPRTWFPCNNCGELFWLLFNQARQTLIRFFFFFEELQNYGLLSWSGGDWHF